MSNNSDITKNNDTDFVLLNQNFEDKQNKVQIVAYFKTKEILQGTFITAIKIICIPEDAG